MASAGIRGNEVRNTAAKRSAVTSASRRYAMRQGRNSGPEANRFLCAILNWAAVTPVKLADWPAVAAYHARLHKRPSVARAFGEELTLYKRHR